MLCSCSQPGDEFPPANPSQVNQYDAEYQEQLRRYRHRESHADAQLEEVDRQNARYREREKRYEQQLDEADRQAARGQEQTVRMDQLLKTWEDQAERQDRLLDKAESVLNRLGRSTGDEPAPK
jgi:predicted RNase H-like nuclease (RuvC/YqgF family)